MKKLISAVFATVLIGSTTAALAQFGPPSFDSLDTDDNGSLSKEEVLALFARFAGGGPGGGGPPGGRPDPEQIFAAWDADGNGAVSEEEFNDRPRRGGSPRGPGGGPPPP